MSEITWGVPKQRTTKVEKFTTPVVTMSAVKKGTGRKMSFNKAAIELLGLVGGESSVAIGFGKDNGIFIQSFDETVDHAHILTNTCTFSNKQVFEHIAKIEKLNTTVENYLHLSIIEGEAMVTVSSISQDDSVIEDTIEVQDKEEEVAEMPEPVQEEEVIPEITDEMLDAEENGTGNQVYSAAGEDADEEEVEDETQAVEDDWN